MIAVLDLVRIFLLSNGCFKLSAGAALRIILKINLSTYVIAFGCCQNNPYFKKSVTHSFPDMLTLWGFWPSGIAAAKRKAEKKANPKPKAARKAKAAPSPPVPSPAADMPDEWPEDDDLDGEVWDGDAAS